MKKITSLMMALGMCVLSVTGCGVPAATKANETKEQTEFTIAFATWIGYAPLFIAEEKGYFKEAGITPKLTIIEDESQYAAAMV